MQNDLYKSFYLTKGYFNSPLRQERGKAIKTPSYIYQMKHILILIAFFITLVAQSQVSDLYRIKKDSSGFELTMKGASLLASLPLKCIDKEFPNKTNHTSLKDSDHVLLPRQLHPAFFGCFDWHSCVHGHWMLVKLLKQFPQLPEANIIRNAINKTITPENIITEVKYFDGELAKGW